jgi:tripartite ATP-independent transporter DctP family solute receptor
MLTRRTFLGSAAATAAIAGGWPHAARAAEFEYTFGHGFPLTHPIHLHAVAAAEKIKAETGGKLVIQVLGNSQLGGDTQILSQVRSGAIQFMTTGGLIFATLVPVASINGMGFVFKDYDAVWKAMDGVLGAHIRAGFEKAGLHAFDKCWDNGFREISSSTRPIAGPKDLEGYKIRVPVSPLYTSLFQALGAAPTSINLAEVYSALQTKVVEGQENPLVLIDAAKFYEVQKYISLTNHVWDGSWIVAHPGSWKTLPADMQAIVAKHFNEGGVAERADVAKQSLTVADELKQKGLVFNQVDPEPFRAALQKAGFYKQWADKFGAENWGVLEQAVGKLT